MMQILKANYSGAFRRVKNGGGWRKVQKVDPSIRCLTGHMPWGMHQYVEGPYKYAVMLRNPVDRVASMYWFIRSFQKHPYHNRAMRNGFTWFVQANLFSDLDNGMTRWLAGREDCGVLKPNGPLTGDDLRLAKAHLQSFSVGFVETFLQDVKNWSWEFGWTLSRPLPHRMGGNYPGPGKGVRKLIRERNAMDMELYEWAKGL
jgi:hypothetical protein